jgi:hypothetical protein
MNLDQAVQTIAKRGFTERQARFLVLVARHSGVCVMRQYSTFAGIVFGQKTRKFFANLVRARLVSTYDAHSRGRVYHLRHRAIYEAVGEPDSRLRRPPSVPRALERLMLLDATLENPDSIWMSSSAEKIDYLSSRGIAIENAPRLVIRQGDQQRARYFPDHYQSASIHPATLPSSTSTRIRCTTSFATSSSDTRLCSRSCPVDDPNRGSGAARGRSAGLA